MQPPMLLIISHEHQYNLNFNMTSYTQTESVFEGLNRQYKHMQHNKQIKAYIDPTCFQMSMLASQGCVFNGQVTENSNERPEFPNPSLHIKTDGV